MSPSYKRAHIAMNYIFNAGNGNGYQLEFCFIPALSYSVYIVKVYVLVYTI